MKFNKNLKKELKEIHIWDFPENMYVKLQKDYRNSFFRLAFLEFETTMNLQEVLKENNLTTNVIRWRTGKDSRMNQLVGLDSLLFIRSYVTKRRNKIMIIYNDIKSKIDFSKKRINKSKDLIFLIKEIRYVFGGNKSLSEFLRINPSTLISYINYNKIKRIPSNLVLSLLKIIEKKIINFTFSLDELENKILSYKSYHGKEIIPEFQNQRKLPIKVTPEFESILYHLMGDGHVKEIGSSEYTQLNEISKKNFLQKLFNIFGYFDFSKNGYENGRVHISKTIIKIICDYYRIHSHDFQWGKSKLPKICSNRNDSFKLAGLIAFIVDEAHIAKSVITIHSSNNYLLSQIREIALDLNLPCSQIRLKKGRGTTKDSFRFSIFKEGVKKLLARVEELEKMYSTCNLAQKKKKILMVASQ